jgi:adenylate kinase
LRLCFRRGRCPDPIVIHLDVPDTVLVSRLTARRQCPRCLRIYNLLWQPPRVSGTCDDDGVALLTREDDKEAVIRERLHAYQELTGPILKWYGDSVVRRVDGGAPPKEVGQAVAEAVGRGGLPSKALAQALV